MDFLPKLIFQAMDRPIQVSGEDIGIALQYNRINLVVLAGEEAKHNSSAGNRSVVAVGILQQG